MVSAEAKYAEATSEARRQQQKLIASLKKMNTRALVRKFTKVFGCEPFNPFDRQEMITDLAAKLNEDIAIPSNPAMRRRAFEQVVGIQRSNGHNGKISDSTVRLIRAMREDGEKYKDISAATGVSPNMCCAIATGLSYKHVN